MAASLRQGEVQDCSVRRYQVEYGKVVALVKAMRRRGMSEDPGHERGFMVEVEKKA